jgi:predicted transcriptional regulator
MTALFECFKPLHFAAKMSSTDGEINHRHRQRSLNKYTVISDIKYVLSDIHLEFVQNFTVSLFKALFLCINL